MLEKIKNLFIFKSVDKCISDNNYDLAMEKLNLLIEDGYKPAETFFKRAQLCQKLLMLEEAHSDYSYIISHCSDKTKAYYERMKLNYELSKYMECICDTNYLMMSQPDNFELKRYKFLSYACLNQIDLAKSYIDEIFNSNKYQAIQFIFTEMAKNIAGDELSKGLKLLDVIELLDPENPFKIYNEASIYELAGEAEKSKELMKKLDSAFPKYFISHFRFTDIYTERDMLETRFLHELKIFDKSNCFAYPMNILEGYIHYSEGHMIDAKECFERAKEINPNKADAYVLLAQVLQIMSGYDNPSYKTDAEENYKIAMGIYQKENLTSKMEDMKRQLKHLNSTLSFS